MKVLMLVNWKIKYCDEIPEGVQPPDYFVKGEPYWFFKYFHTKDLVVDVADVHSFRALERFEKNTIRFYIWQTLRVLPKLREYDYVISHGMQSGIVLCLIRRLFGKGQYKHIVFDIGAFNSARESGRALKLMQFASKSLDGVIYHTKAQKKYYEKCHPWLLDKSEFIAFGTDTEFFKSNDKEETEPYILCAGYHQRDWMTLIEAYNKSSQSYKLRLLGTPTESVKKKIIDNSNIEIFSPTGIEGFKDQIKKAQFCVLPLENLNYSFGQMTLLQQMAMKKTVLAADVPSLDAYLHSYTADLDTKKCTVSYISGDILDLCDKLNYLMENPDVCNEIGLSAERIVRDKFDEKTMACQIEEFINRVN